MRKIALFLMFAAVALADGKLASVNNGFVKKSKDPKVFKISVLSEAEAKTLFDEFKRDKVIPFKYPIDGCYARATEMALLAEKERIVMGKVYAEGNLQVKTDLPKFPLVQWGWHVAPIAYVIRPNGVKSIMVFDPSLFDGPVTVDDWKNRMLYNTPNYPTRLDSLYFGERYQYYPKAQENQKLKWSKNDLDNVKATFKAYSVLQDFSGNSTSSMLVNEKGAGAK